MKYYAYRSQLKKRLYSRRPPLVMPTAPPPACADFVLPQQGTFTQPGVVMSTGGQNLTMVPAPLMQGAPQQPTGAPPAFAQAGQHMMPPPPHMMAPPPSGQFVQGPPPQHHQQFHRGGHGGARGGRGGRGGMRGGHQHHHHHHHHHPLQHQHQHGGHVRPHHHQQHQRQGGHHQHQQQKVEQQPPRPKVEPDVEFVKQFSSRYEMQEEPHETSQHEMLNANDCCDVVEENDVTFIVTDTGTGKSSLIPKELVKRGARVVSSQPRRTAAVNLALRVSDLMGQQVGQSVGYCVRGERVGDDKLPLMYMTSYTVLLHVISHPTDLKYTHFVIDEFHERQADVEVLLSLLKLAKQQQKMPIKIILMSASVELEAWRSYFDGLKVGEYNTCKPRYSVHEYYAEEVCRLIGAQRHPTPKGDIVQSIALHNSLHFVERMLAFLASHTAPEHCVLVFLPGRTNVEQMATWIHKHHNEQLEPIQWYRDVELAAIHAAVNRTVGRKKKVYLATDIAEVSITLPDVVFVIDSGTTKKPRIDPKSRNSVAFPALELLWCSRSAVAQRRGRVGRVQQGFYFSMIQEAQLSNLSDMEPQISNSRINELSLHVLEIAANPLAVFNLGRTTPKLESVQLSMNTLLDGGCAMLSSHPNGLAEAMDNDDAKPWTEHIMEHPINKALHGETFITTVKGIITQHLPLSIESAQIVWMGLLFGVEPLMNLAAAIVACGTPFYTFGAEDGRESKNPELRKKTIDAIKSMSYGVHSDVVAAVDVVLQYKELKLTGQTQEGEEEWCREHSVSSFRLNNILTLEKQIRNQLAEQLSYRDLEDIDALRAMLEKHARAISLMTCAAHLERGIYCVNDQKKQQQMKTAGPCIFLGLKAQKDEFVASCVPWSIGTVVIPLSMQLRYDRLLASFSLELMPRQYDFLLLCFVHDLVLEPKKDEATGAEFAVFGIELQGQRLMFQTNGKTAATVLEFRRRLGTKVRQLRVLAETKVSVSDADLVQEKCDELLAKHGLTCDDKVADTSAYLLQALEFIFDPANLPEFECEPFRNGDFSPKLHSMLLSTAIGVQPLPVKVTPTIPARLEEGGQEEAAPAAEN